MTSSVSAICLVASTVALVGLVASAVALGGLVVNAVAAVCLVANAVVNSCSSAGSKEQLGREMPQPPQAPGTDSIYFTGLTISNPFYLK